MQIPNRKKTIFLTGSAKVAVSGATKTTSHRCLDAAHGKTVNPIVARERPRQIGLSPETARTDLIAGKCGRGPTTPGHADAFQGSRVTETVARSRRCEAISKETAAKGAEQWFYYEGRCVHLVRNFGRSLRGTLAGLRCAMLRPARLEEPDNSDDEIIRPGRLRGGARL